MGVIAIVVMVVALSGCTSTSTSNSNSNQKHYDKNNVSFNYPTSWSVTEDSIIESSGAPFIKLKTGESEARIWVYPVDKSTVEYGNFPVTETVGNVTYKKMPAEVGSSLVSYVIRKDGKDFFMIGATEDEVGHKMILESATF
nr:hypothetical protein [uncultured Methanobacterium sp.]